MVEESRQTGADAARQLLADDAALTFMSRLLMDQISTETDSIRLGTETAAKALLTDLLQGLVERS
jgi:ribosomal protein S11